MRSAPAVFSDHTEFSYPPIPETVWKPWFDGGEFTSDWVHWKLAAWSSIFGNLKTKQAKILEIGSWEGRSAIALLNLLPRSRITCIDIFSGKDRERRFDENLGPYGHRVRKIKNESRNALVQLLAEGRQYDIIYVDGDHHRETTLSDTILAWPMLRRSGIILWDDYLWETHLPSHERPQEAIDWFLNTYAKELVILHSGFQVAAKKISEQYEQNFIARRTVKNLINFLIRKKLKRS